MFENRLKNVLSKSKTIRNNLGNKPLPLAKLEKGCKEFAKCYKYGFEVRALSGIPTQEWRGFSTFSESRIYYVLIDKNLTEEKKWFIGAHECAHILFHHYYLRDTNHRANRENEEEAHLFAQLCFWPLNKIAARGPFDMGENGLVKALVDYQMVEFEKKGFNYERDKLEIYAYLFIRRLERFMPHTYHRLLSSLQSFPILVQYTTLHP